VSEYSTVQWGGEVEVILIAQLVSLAPYALFEKLAGGRRWNAVDTHRNTVPVCAALGEIENKVNGHMQLSHCNGTTTVKLDGQIKLVVMGIPQN